MFISKNQRIDVRNDSISTALLKKADNKTLSNTTLNKLVKIANTHYGLTKAEAEKVFIKNQAIETSGHSVKLAFELKKVISHVTNSEIKTNIENFIRNSNPHALHQPINRMPTDTINQIKNLSAAEFVEAYSSRIGQPIGEGTEAMVLEDNENNHKVFKIFFDDVKNSEIINQANSFRKFYGKNSAHIIAGRAIYMDYIKGSPLSQIAEFPAGSVTNFMSLLQEMVGKGCTPSDMSENNFLYDKTVNKFLPVDITTSEGNKINKNGLNYIINYISNKSAA